MLKDDTAVPNGKPKMKRVSTYVYEDEYNKLRAALIVKYNGMGVSEWQRSVIRSFLKKQEEEVNKPL